MQDYQVYARILDRFIPNDDPHTDVPTSTVSPA